MSSRNHYFLLAFSCCIALCLAGMTPQAQAQVPEDCPNVCTHQYSLCIAASCDDEGNCNDDNCSAIWSTAGVGFLAGQPQCDDCE